jgi:hypothetical protein
MAWAMAFVLTLGLSGCGGDSTPPQPAADSKPAAAPAPAGVAKPKAKARGLTEGGDLTARERRDAKKGKGVSGQ